MKDEVTSPSVWMDPALQRLEFGRVLEVVAAHASSDPGARRVQELRPGTELHRVNETLKTTDEMVGLLLRDEAWAPPRIPDLEGPLRRLRAAGSVLTGAELADAAVLLASSRRARGDQRRDPARFPRLAQLAAGLLKAPAEEARLMRALDASGSLADGASPTLKRIRRSLRDARGELVARLERFARSLPARLQVPDASVTVRSGRYCIPVRREGVSEVGGIVHDESATHRTVFVEPPLAIEPMNRIRELELAEVREVERVLRELTDLLRPRGPELVESLEILVRADAWYACARYALSHGGSRPEIGADAQQGTRSELRLVHAAHPLLLASGEPAVPFDLTMGPDETVLLISGPNAGGKTVTLKSVGLVSALAQSGVIPPVGPGTRLPLFRRIFAVIGDEQSIEASLSTFSAQLQNLRAILSEADSESLALVDEIGGNTDPAEGAALAAVALLRLADQARLTLATSHLGDLKALTTEDSRIVNASMQFDTEALRPTFRLVRDRPGRSYALEIARRIGLPENLIEAARGRLSAGTHRVDRVLGDLEAREVELTELAREARSARRDLETREAGLAERERQAMERAAEADRLHRQAERGAVERTTQYLLEARREVEREIERLRVSGVGGEGQEAQRAARSTVERLLRDARERHAAAASVPDVTEVPLGVGDRVECPDLGLRGLLRELRGGEAIVDAGGLRVTVPVAALRPAVFDDRQAAPGRMPAADSLPQLVPRPELDLRGRRADEVEAALVPALDAAIAGDLPSLRIIHGKGTGALRDVVRDLLRRDSRIARFRAGAFEEGGSGVTVVEFGSTGTGA